MIDLPVPSSSFSLGITKYTNNIRVEGSVDTSNITARFSVGYCTVTLSNSVPACSDATSDVPLVSGSFDFASFCKAF
jgi:hypothetical protein